MGGKVDCYDFDDVNVLSALFIYHYDEVWFNVLINLEDSWPFGRSLITLNGYVDSLSFAIDSSISKEFSDDEGDF